MVQSYLAKGVPYEDYVYSSYPCKTDGAIVRAFVTYAKMHPDRAEASLTVARRAADFLISLMLPEESPLAHFPPTYRILKPTRPFTGKDFQADKVARRYKGQNMLVYPAMVASSFLDLHKAVGEAKYLEAAKKIAGTYVKLQGEDGTWYLKLNEKDGTPVAPNRLVPGAGRLQAVRLVSADRQRRRQNDLRVSCLLQGREPGGRPGEGPGAWRCRDGHAAEARQGRGDSDALGQLGSGPVRPDATVDQLRHFHCKRARRPFGGRAVNEDYACDLADLR